MRNIAIIAILFLIQGKFHAQGNLVLEEDHKNRIDKTFHFNDENYEHSIFIDIEKGTKKFTFQIKGQLVFGRMTATLFDLIL